MDGDIIAAERKRQTKDMRAESLTPLSPYAQGVLGASGLPMISPYEGGSWDNFAWCLGWARGNLDADPRR